MDHGTKFAYFRFSEFLFDFLLYGNGIRLDREISFTPAEQPSSRAAKHAPAMRVAPTSKLVSRNVSYR